MTTNEIDNKLLSTIQKHFPSLPLDDRFTDWGKWLAFSRTIYVMGVEDGGTVGEIVNNVLNRSNEDMVLVTKEDANNYCQILSALGMEEEGDPVQKVIRMKAALTQIEGESTHRAPSKPKLLTDAEIMDIVIADPFTHAIAYAREVEAAVWEKQK